MNDKKTIAVFFGGMSPEHDISIVTAISSIIKPLETMKRYFVVPVYIAKDGTWYSESVLKDIKTFQSGKINETLDKIKPISVIFDKGLVIEKVGLKRKRIRIDVAFPSMHGGNGEDGSLMGLLRLANIPFVGCDMTASAVAMDKLIAKQIAEANGIAVAKYEHVFASDSATDSKGVLNRIEKSLTYPLFVKPTHLGSSIGISKVSDRKTLHNAIEVAAYYDNKIIIEESIANLIEVTVPIIGNETIETAFVEKPLSSSEFFDFDTKYMNGGQKTGGLKQQSGAHGYSELPAQLPQELYDKAVDTAHSVYRSLECEGIARIDLLIDSKTQVVYFNEVNPMPGSLYAHNWRATGLSNVVLVEKLIAFAFDRHKKQKKLEKTFSTNFLKQF